MKKQAIFLAMALIGGLAAIGSTFGENGVTTTLSSSPTLVGGRMASLHGATDWINSAPLDRSSLRGKVVVVDFWTYTCINWRRTAPYLRAWSDKYKDAGLVVLGVHSPEFEFEKDLANVQWATEAMQLPYPIAVDNDHAIWRAFGNQYWPAIYVVDAEGRIRHHLFGEGDYEQAEEVIRQLLKEAGARSIGSPIGTVHDVGAEATADWANLGSPENYLGYKRTERFASPGGPRPARRHEYAAPQRLDRNQWALQGDWTMRPEAALLHAANGKITYRFHARDLHIVMGPAEKGKAVRFRVRVDGHEPGASHGVDVDSQGNGRIVEQRMYQLIRQSAPITDREFEIEFLEPDVEVFAFTFG